jgi:hypothetical protein
MVGKSVIPKLPENPLFSERRCSGRSLRTPWARIGGARNCLLVAVTKDVLFVTPSFPFNLMFLPEIYGLEHRIAVSAIRDVDDHRGMFGRRVTVSYENQGLHRLELRVRRPDAFINALRQLQRSI